MDINALIANIYHYYPKNLSPFSHEYELAKETWHKQVAIQKAKSELSPAWLQFVVLMEDQFDSSQVTGDTGTDGTEFCNYLAYRFTRRNIYFRFHILLSLMAPYHTLLMTVYKDRGETPLITCDYEDVGFYLPANELQHLHLDKDADYINSHLVKLFNTEMVRKKDFDRIIIPDIATQTCRMGTVSVFDCLFTDPYSLH